jgi:hypothetical protein
MSIFKEVRFKDRYAAKFTFDTFNTLNLAIWGQPNSAYSAPNNGQSTAPNFGVINSTAGSSRTVQLSGKFSF